MTIIQASFSSSPSSARVTTLPDAGAAPPSTARTTVLDVSGLLADMAARRPELAAPRAGQRGKLAGANVAELRQGFRDYMLDTFTDLSADASLVDRFGKDGKYSKYLSTGSSMPKKFMRLNE